MNIYEEPCYEELCAVPSPQEKEETGVQAILPMSCPNCERMVDMNMALVDENEDAQFSLRHLTVPESYCFRGMIPCSNCGKLVMACLTVTAHKL